MAEEEVDWEAQWSNIVETTEDRFSKGGAEENSSILPQVEFPSLENIDQSMAQFATQFTEGWQHLTEEVQRNFTEDWVKLTCDDMKESLLKEEQEENSPEASWTDMYNGLHLLSHSNRLLPSQQKLPFKDIRKHFGITIHEMVESVQVDNVVGTYSEGKSGEVLVISKDLKFVLKTLSFTEYRLLFSFLPAYLEFIKENPKTLLVRFYATFMSRGQYFIVMNNIFATGGGVPREKYDLKGATSNRYTPEEFRTKGRTYKDGDFVNSGRHIYVPSDTFEVLSEQIRKDTEFLATQHVMDYSLLVGIIYDNEEEIDDEKDFLERIAAQPLPANHGITKSLSEMLPTWLTPGTAARDPIHNTTTTTTTSNGIPSTPATPDQPPSSPTFTSPRSARKIVPASGSTGANFPNSFSAYNPETKKVEHVCLGIIDMFMYYHDGRALFSLWRKMTEDENEISTVDPVSYSQRFHRWMFTNVFMDTKKSSNSTTPTTQEAEQTQA